MTPVLIEMTPTRQPENQNQQQILPSSPESELEHQPNNKKPVTDPIMPPITVDSDDGDNGSSELVQVGTKVTVEPNNQNTDDTITTASNFWV